VNLWRQCLRLQLLLCCRLLQRLLLLLLLLLLLSLAPRWCFGPLPIKQTSG